MLTGLAVAGNQKVEPVMIITYQFGVRQFWRDFSLYEYVDMTVKYWNFEYLLKGGYRNFYLL